MTVVAARRPNWREEQVEPMDWSGLAAEAILDEAESRPLAALMAAAASLRDAAGLPLVSYSRKVFIPLTKLCRDVCHYCTFAERPRAGVPPYLTRAEVLKIARAGAASGCQEALFTLGDKPELRYRVAAEALAELGFPSTIAYLAAMCRTVLDETGLLPHVNPGVLSAADLALLRPVAASMGLMLESAAERLMAPGEVHHGSPDKAPALRLETIRLAGEMKIPFTSGILIGIGETRLERIEALLQLRALHRRYGHVQEIIIQNFRAKPGTRAAAAPDPTLDELLWTIAVARLTFGPAMNIQAPPNLTPELYPQLIRAGLNDWGGVSPVTIDHVNPEAPWPGLAALRRATADEGKVLVERLTLYPSYVANAADWVDPALLPRVLDAADAEGYARLDRWSPGLALEAPDLPPHPALAAVDGALAAALARAASGRRLDEDEIVRLFAARDREFEYLGDAADELRQSVSGDAIGYVVNRNINYTNICYFRCGFCAFSKGKTAETLRGAPYDLALEEVVRRTREAWARGATEVCLQGGIHPDYTGATYLALCGAIKAAVPEMHLHAFSPLEISQGAATLGIAVPEFLAELKAAGLGTLPGTAAEVLDDGVRAILCPDKLKTAEWLSVVAAAHRVGLRTTSTIMFGHVDDPRSWARHLLRLRDLQEETGGFTEFVPLPFVPMEAPIYRKGRARRGPTVREAVLMHAVARLALHPLIPNIQASWVKLGVEGVKLCLAAGANDLGGTLMNESISRAAGTQHGQEMPPAAMAEIARALGRRAAPRDTLYRSVSPERVAAALAAAPLAEVVQTPPGDAQALSRAAFATL
jgi:FO synthase